MLIWRLKFDSNSSNNEDVAFNCASLSIELRRIKPSSRRIIAFLKLSSPARFLENSLGVLLLIHSSASLLLISLWKENGRSEYIFSGATSPRERNPGGSCPTKHIKTIEVAKINVKKPCFPNFSQKARNPEKFWPFSFPSSKLFLLRARSLPVFLRKVLFSSITKTGYIRN